MKRIGTCAMLMVLLAGLAGCSSQAYEKSILARANTLRTAPEYQIGEGDNLAIVVLGHPEYEMRDLVRPDGKVSFPQHGDIVVAGKTVEAVRQELERRGHRLDMYPDYTRNSAAVEMILAEPAPGFLRAGADPRQPAYAIVR